MRDELVPSPPAAAAAARRERGRVPIRGGVWAEKDRRGLRGGGDGGGVRSGPGAARTIILFHIISARPSKQPLMVRTFLKIYGAWLLFFVSVRTNKRHHHHRLVEYSVNEMERVQVVVL